MSGRRESHSRQNLLTGEWVLVSPHRTERPWQGQLDEPEADTAADYEPDCYLCPGNSRAGGHRNPDYRGAFVFDNDFPALLPAEAGATEDRGQPLFRSRPETGRCRVVCYSERHDLRLATMTVDQIAAALEAMFAEFRTLDRRDDIGYVQMFENRGAMMGCSNMHPHAQIWATRNVPNEPGKELQTQLAYFRRHSRPMLLDYLQRELELDERVVAANDRFAAVVPYWAVWPYEALILPRRPLASPDDFDSDDVAGLAETFKRVLSAYDSLFAASVPYSMGFHPRPSDGNDCAGWIFHAHIYPPLLRSATVRKHMVGFEMLGMPQRDLTPELAAERLREAC